MTERMENALRHIKTSVDVDPWAVEEVERVFKAYEQTQDGELLKKTDTNFNNHTDKDAILNNSLINDRAIWIPVSERLPEEREWIGTKIFGTTISDEVYVTFEISDSKKRFAEHLSFQNGKVPLSKKAEIDAFAKGAIPIAWQPLPKPYEPQEGAKE